MNVKKYLLLFLFAIPILCSGQDLYQPQIVGLSKTYLGFSVGPAFPADKFAGGRADSGVGHAQMGYRASLDGAFIFLKNLGLGWNFGLSQNSVAADSYQIEIATRLPNPSGLNVTSLNSTSWTNAWLVIGPYFSMPQKKFVFDGQFLVGLGYVQAPDITVDAMHNSLPLTHTSGSDSGISMAMQVALGLGYRITQRWRMITRVDYHFTRPNVSIRVSTEEEGFAITSRDELDFTVSMFSLNFGLAYEFERNKKTRQRNRKFGRMN